MCGLAGVMSKNMDMAQIGKFKDIFTIAQIRGDNGAGVAVVPCKTKPDHVGIRRTVWSSGHLVTTQDFYDVTKKSCSIIVGHARAPTRGESTIKNVHPHRHGDIILVHNGTMQRVDNVQVTSTQKHTDSAMIAECIAKKGPHEFVQNSLGAYALVWIDLKKQTLNFLRNGERTLWLGFEKDSIISGDLTTLWWASELPMMAYPLSRYASYNKDRFDYKLLPKDEWWSFPLDVPKKLEEPTVEKCEKKYPVSNYSGPYSHWSYYDDDQGDVDVPFDTGKKGGTASSGAQGSFSYTPPEQRATSTGTNSNRRVLTVAEVLEKRRAAAARSTGSRIHGERSGATGTAVSSVVPITHATHTATTHGKKSLLQYAIMDEEEIETRLKSGGCVWCSETPSPIAGMQPTIFPVRHTQNRNEYVCSQCILDDDVQVWVGVK